MAGPAVRADLVPFYDEVRDGPAGSGPRWAT